MLRAASEMAASPPGSDSGTTQASTSSPRTASGTAATATDLTSGCCISTLSTSTAEMFSPLRRITFFFRSTKRSAPSSSRRTISPVWNQPSCHASAVAASSLR
ncbi:hypothetical protein G6F68_018570 [Rhizopus microsporus]|nr:hypothetical protein G6F68_018570 [Rhizopus microsporus]